jgi:NADH-quinone oxidoreductase subunit M
MVVLLALPFVAAVVVALLGSRHGMLALFGHSHELAAVVGSQEAVEALEARARERQGHIVRGVALGATLLALVITIVLAWGVAGPRIRGDFSHESLPTVRHDLITIQDGSSIQFYLKLDGMNVWLVVLTSVLMVSSVLVSWKAITERTAEFYAWLLVLQGAMTGVFLAFDIVMFYVFFEMTLIPLFFLIGIWGGEERQYAARKFFVYTLAGGLITLVGVIGVIIVLSHDPVRHATENAVPKHQALTFAIPELVQAVDYRSKYLAADVALARKELETAKSGKAGDVAGAEKIVKDAEQQQDNWRYLQYILFAAMMVGFAVKVPLFPVHTWLPLAHVQAPTAGSVLLAGVLLKIGTYGLLRLCIQLAPDAALTFGAPLLGSLAVVGILYGAFCALAQDDMKKLVAYSSVSHLGFCVLGLFALNELGLQGALLQMINHGLSTGALFLIVGMLYERYHTRKLADYGGMAAKLKLLGAFMVFITMSSVGLPGLNGFVGEYCILSGMFAVGKDVNVVTGPWINGQFLAVLASFGVVLGAWYMLSLLRGVYFGEVKEPHHDAAHAPSHGHGHAIHSAIKDLNWREVLTLAPIAGLCLLLGVYPQPVLDTSAPEIRAVSRALDEARERRSGTVAAAPSKPESGTHALANPPQANPGE